MSRILPGHAVERRCKLRGSRPLPVSSSRGSGASGTRRDWLRSPAPIQFARRRGCYSVQGLGTANVRGVDGDAPVDAQDAPTGACKTAPHQARGFAHRPQPFNISVAGTLTAAEGRPQCRHASRRGADTRRRPVPHRRPSNHAMACCSMPPRRSMKCGGRNSFERVQ
jgi:hypothetical protein